VATDDDTASSPASERQGERWYDLFSRGARDWLRHNEKVRDAVRQQLPELISNSDTLTPQGGDTTVRVPVRFLEHYRFQLRSDGERSGVGQGQGEPGDMLVGPRQAEGSDRGEGGDEQGGHEFILELKIDDIVDWLWEELKLPNLKQKSGSVSDDDYVREGGKRRGVRSRLDRRRSVKEAIKRRAIQPAGPAFTDDDLRYRQLVMRKRPSTEAVVFFAMDVSSSMTQSDRQLSKTFFFWVLQGLRRQYTRIETVFIAHTVEAWEFTEDEFFQVSGSGGTAASTAFNKASEIIDARYDPSRFNMYMFYASDGANFAHDRENSQAALAKLNPIFNYMGYVEVGSVANASSHSETWRLFEGSPSGNSATGCYTLSTPESIWEAIRTFFSEQAAATGSEVQ